MYIHKNHLIKSPGLYTIYVKNRRKKKNSLVCPFYKWERKIFGYFNFRLRLCLFEHGKKKKKNCLVCQVRIVIYVWKQFDRLNLSSLKKSF